MNEKMKDYNSMTPDERDDYNLERTYGKSKLEMHDRALDASNAVGQEIDELRAAYDSGSEEEFKRVSGGYPRSEYQFLLDRLQKEKEKHDALA